MSKKINRYSLGIKEDIIIRNLKGTSVRDIIDYITRYNSNPNNPFFLGEVDFNYKMGIVSYYKFRKITKSSTLEEIDLTTRNFENDYELKKFYGVNIKNNHNVIVMYRYNKDIRLLPTFYKKYSNLLGIKEENGTYTFGENSGHLERKLMEYGTDINFINKLLSDGRIEVGARESIDDYDKLYILREMLKYNSRETVSPEPLLNFYKSFIFEKGKFNYFNYRLIAGILSTYMKSLEKGETPEEDKMSFDEFDIEELRGFYEDLKIAKAEGNYNEVLREGINRLKKHK